MNRILIVMSVAWTLPGCGGEKAKPAADDKKSEPAAVATQASCQNPANRYCTEWSGPHWTAAGGDAAGREAATRTTCEQYAKGTYRLGTPCSRDGLVGACRHGESVRFWYTEKASAMSGCRERVGDSPGGYWYEPDSVNF